LARIQPQRSSSIYLLVIGCRSPQAVERVLDNFVGLGIPIDTLSRNDGPGPFT